MQNSSDRRLRKKVKPMDKLKSRLREDAAKIQVEVSPELDDRIRASLESVRQEKPATAASRRPGASLWWASSLTGVAVALLVLTVMVSLDRNQTEPVAPVERIVEYAPPPQLNLEPAVLTAPLQKELENLESDLRKAEQVVMADIGLKP